jgi:hypothetical protein
MTDTATLIAALRILVREIQSDDGIANSCIAEAADRIEQLDTMATEVLRASHHGDQHFIQCLTYSDPGTTRLRLAIVAMADYLREQP